MKISIGKLANIFGLTKEALHFYEKKGILEPTRDEANKYRFFTPMDIQKIGSVRKLANLNFTLNEIKDIYGGMSEINVIALFKGKAEDLAREAILKARICERLAADLRLIESYNLSAIPIIERCPEYYRFDFGTIENLVENQKLHTCASQWFSLMPLTAASLKIKGTADILTSYKSNSRGLIIEKRVGDELGIYKDKNVALIPSSPCITIIANFAGNMAEDSIKKMSDYIRDNNIKICSDIFSVSLLSYKNERGENITLSKIFYPIEVQHE